MPESDCGMESTFIFHKFADRLTIISKSNRYFLTNSSFTDKEPEVSLVLYFYILV